MVKRKRDVKLATTGGAQDFMDALGRLQSGVPSNPDLKVLNEAGKLRISIKTVALEAGRSRTDIAHAKCRYPEVRAEILAITTGKGETKKVSVTEKNVELRSANKDLVATVKLAMSRVAAMLIRMNKLESDYKKKVGEMRRRSHHLDGDEIVGVALQDADRNQGNVVSIDDAKKARIPPGTLGQPT